MSVFKLFQHKASSCVVHGIETFQTNQHAVNYSVTLCQDEKQRFASVLLLARLLAKFLGFISFLPYQTSERPSKEIQDAAIILRSKVRKNYDVLVLV